jgi:hypothetical protein
VSDNLWTAREMNVERQSLRIDASKPGSELYFTSICFVLIVVCNKLAMRVDIIIFFCTTRQKAAQGTFVAWLWQ